WDLQAHAARPAAVTQEGVYPYDYARVPAAPVLALGAAGAVPGSVGVVQGDGEIPYKPEALAKKKENAENWIDRDPELKCYLPGIPRDVHTAYLPDHAQHAHDSYRLLSLEHTAHSPSVQGRRSARRDMEVPCCGRRGRRRIVRRCVAFQRSELDRPRRQLSQRRAAPGRAFQLNVA